MSHTVQSHRNKFTRIVHAAVLFAAISAILAGCGPATTAKTAPAAPGSTSVVDAPSAPASGGVLAADDPDHGTVQSFPAPGTCHSRAVAGGVLPDAACTPGATDPHVTEATLSTTICRSGGYTTTVRPAESVTAPEKKASMASYADTASASTFEFDHLVSLELGGSPNSPRNLWPQPGSSPNPKDKLEGALHDLVCSHKMKLADAQAAIAGDWVAAYRQVVGTSPTG